jgi:Tfp pilus assembly protein PilO
MSVSRNDRMILLVVPVVVAVVAFWFMVLAPKQDKAKKLDQQLTELQSSVTTQQQAAQAGLAARKHFASDYHKLVVMGKAVPVDDETASLLVQLNTISQAAGTSFRKIDLTQGATASGTTAPAPAAPAAPAPTTSSDSSSSSSVPATTAAPATESSAALLPIGATVGSAGLPTLPYSLTFRGSYHQIADFLEGVDGLVKSGKGTVAANGRLVTIDSFDMAPSDNGAPGTLDAVLNVTTYVTPASQGLTAGATPTSPAPTAPAPEGTVSSTPTASTAPAPTP